VTGVLEGAVNIPFGVGLKKGTVGRRLRSADPRRRPDRGHRGALAQPRQPRLRRADARVRRREAAQNFNVLRRGSVYVQVEEAVVAHDVVFVRYAAGAGGTQLGAFRKSATRPRPRS
jgi:hypothetical protein